MRCATAGCIALVAGESRNELSQDPGVLYVSQANAAVFHLAGTQLIWYVCGGVVEFLHTRIRGSYHPWAGGFDVQRYLCQLAPTYTLSLTEAPPVAAAMACS